MCNLHRVKYSQFSYTTEVKESWLSRPLFYTLAKRTRKPLLVGRNSWKRSGYTTDAGTLVDTSCIDFGSSPTASHVESWRLTLVRGQAYEFFFNPGSYDPSSISSGMFGGTLEIVQSPNATTVPSSAFTVRIYPTAADQIAGTNIIGTIATKINLDVPSYNRNAGQGRVARMHTLIDTSAGGTPCAFS